MSTFVLVHGAWHGAWCWSKVSALLEQAGHTVIAPDLPGHGDNRVPIEDINERSYARCVIDSLKRATEPVILLGHSLGGWTISQVAEEVPDKIALLVYLSALLPQDGETYLSLSASDTESRLLPHIAFGTTYASLSSNEAAIVEALYHDCSEEDRALALRSLVPEPLAAIAPALHLSQRFERVPRVFVACLQDRAIGPQLQGRMHTAQPCQVFELNTSHSPFLSAPGALTDMLLSLAQDDTLLRAARRRNAALII